MICLSFPSEKKKKKKKVSKLSEAGKNFFRVRESTCLPEAQMTIYNSSKVI